MSTISHGMNLDEVEALGRLLQTKGEQLRHLTSEVESALARTDWGGPDAMAFKQQWWPSHRSSLQAVAEQVHGFGQSALNNASEQRTASGDAGVGLGGGIGAMTASASPDWSSAAMLGAVPAGVVAFFNWLSHLFVGAVPPDVPRASPGPPKPPARSGATPGADRSKSEVISAYKKNSKSPEMRLGSHAFGGRYQWQCTAWAMYRWRELGFTGDFGTVGGRTGNGGDMAAYNHGSTHTPPTPGAMASYPGHVVIVEEVLDGGNSIRISEMNSDGNPDVAGESEFQYRTLTRSGDLWLSYGKPVTIAFATHPSPNF